MKTSTCLLSVLAAAFTAGAQSDFEAMLDYVPAVPPGSQISSPISTDISGPMGWTFQPTTDLEVTALGAFNYVLPSRGSLEVGLWSSSGTLLASQFVSATSTAVDQSHFQSIASVLLTAGQTYFIAAFLPGGQIQAIAVTPDTLPNGYATMSPEIQLDLAAYNTSSSFSFPGTTDGYPGCAIIAPNFEFQPVPEPSIGWLLSGGMMGVILVRRSLARNGKII